MPPSKAAPAAAGYHEGTRLLEVLREHGKNPQDLANAAEVEWPSVQKYTKAERIGVRAWETCRAGLRRLDIDPRLVRPDDDSIVATSFMPSASGPLTQLNDVWVGFLEGLDESQLPIMRDILCASDKHQRVFDYVSALLRIRGKVRK